MRRVAGLAVALLMVALVGCSSYDSMAVEFTLNDFRFDLMPFSASGVAVDEGVVCESGTMESDHFESPEGETFTSEEGAARFEAARADEGVMEWYRVDEFVCDDGSGTFTMRVHSRFDFAKPVSEQDLPTWEIESGTGDHAALSGSGDMTSEPPPTSGEALVFSGQVQAG